MGYWTTHIEVLQGELTLTREALGRFKTSQGRFIARALLSNDKARASFGAGISFGKGTRLPSGEGGLCGMDEILDLLRRTKGSGDVLVTWEGGDSLTGLRVEDGKAVELPVRVEIGEREGELELRAPDLRQPPVGSSAGGGANAPLPQAPTSWFQTWSGRGLDLVTLCPDDILLEDIAHALSLICRFSGHVSRHYSVAEHSVRVEKEVARCGGSIFERRRALLHDASEAYLSDLPKPVKDLCPDYRALEERVMAAIWSKFGLPPAATPFDRRVVEADLVMLATEKRDLLAASPRPWGSLPEPLDQVITPWPTARGAEEEFLDVAHGLWLNLP